MVVCSYSQAALDNDKDKDSNMSARDKAIQELRDITGATWVDKGDGGWS